MTDDKPAPRRAALLPKPESSTRYRLGHLDQLQRDIGERIQGLDERLRKREIDTPRELAELKGKADNLKLLIDQAQKEISELTTRLKGHDDRLDELEKTDAASRRPALVAAGGGAAGGTLLMAIIELARRLLS